MAGKGFTVKKDWDNPTEHAMPAEARVPAEVRLGPVVVAPATVLAPMAGVTDTVFRRFIRHASLFTTDSVSGSASGTGESSVDSVVTNAQSGCGLLMTEFTSADGVTQKKDKKAQRFLNFNDDEHPITSQLFGSNPVSLAEAARIVEGFGFDMVDLNLGCPAKKVVKCNGGSGLLRELPVIQKIFEAVRAAVKIPFTVKFRAGWSESELVFRELAKMAEGCGLNAIAMHARTREQGYSGQAQWQWIAELKSLVSIPVIGNGDIRTPEDARAMVAETGCDAVMIGRAAASNPWIFRQIAQYTAEGNYEIASRSDRYEMIRRYFGMLVEEGRPDATGKMKQFASWFTHGVEGGAKLRKAIYEAKNPAQIVDAVEMFFVAPTTGAAEDGIIVESCFEG